MAISYSYSWDDRARGMALECVPATQTHRAAPAHGLSAVQRELGLRVEHVELCVRSGCAAQTPCYALPELFMAKVITAATPDATPASAAKVVIPSRGVAQRPRFSSLHARGKKTNLIFCHLCCW